MATLTIHNSSCNEPFTTTTVAPAPTANSNYGYLYNYYAVVDNRNLANTGWKVPSIEDYENLVLFIGDGLSLADSYGIAGGHLKEVGLDHWIDPNVDAYDTYNFSAVGSGYRGLSGGGDFSNLGSSGHIRSTSITTLTRVLYIAQMGDASSDSGLYEETGAGVRLLKETPTPAELALSDGSRADNYTGNDGKTYPTVKIGNQVWISVNLVETKYRNEDWIKGYDNGSYAFIDGTTWGNLTEGALCAYNDDENNVYTI